MEGERKGAIKVLDGDGDGDGERGELRQPPSWIPVRLTGRAQRALESRSEFVRLLVNCNVFRA